MLLCPPLPGLPTVTVSVASDMLELWIKTSWQRKLYLNFDTQFHSTAQLLLEKGGKKRLVFASNK